MPFARSSPLRHPARTAVTSKPKSRGTTVSTTEALASPGGTPTGREAEPMKAVALWVACTYSDVHNLAEALADAVSRWRKARRLLRRTSEAGATRRPQHVVGWLACPECSVEVPVSHVPMPGAGDDDGARLAAVELAMADLWMHSLVHEQERR